ncbi:MAG: bifunctional UDP-sugar hydrolase/5'-nucleotidase [Oscillospiraceae bacterium]
MKHILRCISSLFLAALLVCGLCVPALATPPTTPQSLSLKILFTHDTHDHFLPLPAGDGGEYGGYTRLATLLQQERENAEVPVITVDGGDFSMGSLFQTIYATDAPELRTLGALGYDAVTLGNHEFDYRGQGLADMLTNAKKSGDPLPAVVLSNYKPNPDGSVASATVQTALDNFPVTDYTILERDGLKIAIFGVVGVSSDECSPMSGMTLEPVADAAKRVVTKIEEQEKPDFIVCLSHGGINQDPKKSEDELLAKAVPGIDVIVSGHTHATLEKPIQVGSTLIVSVGAYTQNLGVLTVNKQADKTLAGFDYKLIPVDETVADDPEISALVASFKPLVEQKYLADYGMKFDQVLATAPFDFTPISQFAVRQEDDPLGTLVADSYLRAVQEAEGDSYEPIDVAVVNAGVIRASISRGNVTVSDAFAISALGVGADGTPGYPLISAYLTGKELKDACEVDASVTPIVPEAQLYMTGLHYTFNPNRMIFNKVTQVSQIRPDGTTAPLEDEKLYRCVTGLFSGQMLGAVNAKSFGILTITPKDKDGNVITNFEDHIIHNQNGTEVKEWYALASYLQSMGTIDAKYEHTAGHKNVVPSWNPIELLKNANSVTFIVIAVVLVLLAVLILVPVLIVRHHRKKKARKML